MRVTAKSEKGLEHLIEGKIGTIEGAYLTKGMAELVAKELNRRFYKISKECLNKFIVIETEIL